MIKQPFMSFGSFATYVHPTQRYGIIFGANPKGMQMDIDQIMYQAVSRDNDSNELKGFIQSQGTRQSANEHLVPEQLFDDPKTTEKEVEGVSAVKALQIAQQQGQTIYTITKENYNQVLPKLSLSANVMTDIRDNVAVGRTVTVHEKTINYKGWKGSGYIIIDPTTGAGAYLIDGGANGGYLIAIGIAMVALAITVFVVSLVATTIPATFLGSLLGASLAFNTLLAGLTLILKGIEIKTYESNNSSTLCAISTLFWSALVGNMTGKLANWIGRAEITKEISNTVMGISIGGAQLIRSDLCYKPKNGN